MVHVTVGFWTWLSLTMEYSWDGSRREHLLCTTRLLLLRSQGAPKMWVRCTSYHHGIQWALQFESLRFFQISASTKLDIQHYELCIPGHSKVCIVAFHRQGDTIRPGGYCKEHLARWPFAFLEFGAWWTISMIPRWDCWLLLDTNPLNQASSNTVVFVWTADALRLLAQTLSRGWDRAHHLLFPQKRLASFKKGRLPGPFSRFAFNFR